MFQLRPSQKEILKYAHGTMAISAVPGSGKTHTLSYLAAHLIASGKLQEEQEVLIVTLVNSAVDNFSAHVSSFLKDEFKLLPKVGYRVRTLHGLAHDIVRERPSLAGLSEDFQIVDESDSEEILQRASDAWLHSHTDALHEYLSPELEDSKLKELRTFKIPKLVKDISSEFIRTAKDQRITSGQLLEKLNAAPISLPLARMCCEIYADYQRGLSYRGAVDFDDLVRLAVGVLERDNKFLERLRFRWPYILEDEAQDSNRIQEELLKFLAGPGGNWVRVGDSNQAIYETFTTANPQFFRAFTEGADQSHDLPESGRSTASILCLANHLIDWARETHPNKLIRDALVLPHILPTSTGDPQPNPPDNPRGIRIELRQMNKQDELRLVANSLARWLPEHQDSTVAVLVPSNQRGLEVANELKNRKLDYVDSLLKSSSATRACAGALTYLLSYLADLTDGNKNRLVSVYRVWRRDDRQDGQAWKQVEQTGLLLKQCKRVEDFLWPRSDRDWLLDQNLSPEVFEKLVVFRERVRRWQGAILLPIDQLVITLAQDLFTEPSYLATAHKLAIALKRSSDLHPDWQMQEFVQELKVVANDQRRFLGLSEDDIAFDPDHYKGKVVVATMHKAKGLEWDRVYMLGVNSYDFPSGLEGEEFRSERWFIRDHLNLQAESLAQLSAAIDRDHGNRYVEGMASENANLDYVRERLRLLYVGITRAKRELMITWNTGGIVEKPNKPAIPLQALHEFVEEFANGAT